MKRNNKEARSGFPGGLLDRVAHGLATDSMAAEASKCPLFHR
ncbi:hypothetical protein V1281_007658 [Nitrobacteraceae bacterium AZCC 2161]